MIAHLQCSKHNKRTAKEVANYKTGRSAASCEQRGARAQIKSACRCRRRRCCLGSKREGKSEHFRLNDELIGGGKVAQFISAALRASPKAANRRDESRGNIVRRPLLLLVSGSPLLGRRSERLAIGNFNLIPTLMLSRTSAQRRRRPLRPRARLDMWADLLQFLSVFARGLMSGFDLGQSWSAS